MIAHGRPGVNVTFEDHGEPHGIKPHLRISQAVYDELLDELIVAIADSGWMPNQIVGVMCGGGDPARALNLALGIPLAFLGAESYDAAFTGDGRKMAAARDIQFARDLLKTHPGFGTRVLIADDLADTGRTFHRATEWLKRSPKYGAGIEEVRTGTLWLKECSKFKPDFSVDFVVPIYVPALDKAVMPWIDQPIEINYAAGIDAIRARIRAQRS